MPPLIVAVLVGAGALAGYTVARRVWSSLTDDPSVSRSSEAEQPDTIAEKNLGALELDRATGVYRPARPD